VSGKVDVFLRMYVHKLVSHDPCVPKSSYFTAAACRFSGRRDKSIFGQYEESC
jgi:hypothetical protein